MSIRIRIRYLVVGLFIGGLWIAHRDEPTWEHAVRTLAVLLLVPPLVHLLLRRWEARRAQQGDAPRERFSIARFAIGKVVLVVAWMVIELVLSHWVADADLIVAAGLTLSAAVLGPMLHHHLMVPVGKERS